MVDIVLMIIIATMLIPGSSSRGIELILIPVAIVCIAIIAAVFAVVCMTAVFVAEMTGVWWVGMLAGLGVFFAMLFSNKMICEARERRKAHWGRT